jgi:gliding motility-associated-like protein
MRTFAQSILTALLGLMAGHALLAQPNNDCGGAAPLPNPSDFCSPAQAFNNLFASPSNVPVPGCWQSAQQDVWFVFTAEAPSAVVILNGASTTPGGSLQNPQLALYSGNCPDGLTALGCAADLQGNGILELRVDDLQPGAQYFIRADGVGFGGTFQLCLRNFVFEGKVSGDCPSAVRICNKSPFSVSSVVGPGSDPDEVFDAPCFTGFSESNAAWFVFSIENSGTLTFTLNPQNPNDDLDFVLYRLPNGVGDCNGKIVERCMTAGDLNPASPCMGPTGLSLDDTDLNHNSGCIGPDDNNFLRFLDAVAGNTYALLVNNYISGSSGFDLSWGGSASFVGPDADFGSDAPSAGACIGDSITFTDLSTFNLGSITDWAWSFGASANMPYATGPGPHQVAYGSTGAKTVVLTLLTSNGCSVEISKTFNVISCCNLTATVNVARSCPGGPAAVAELQVEDATEPLQILWSIGIQDSTRLNGLAPGAYAVSVTDAAGCAAFVPFSVPQLLDFDPVFPRDSILLLGQSISLAVAPPQQGLQVQWSPDNGSPQNGNPITVQPATTTQYVATATLEGCSFQDTVNITVLDRFFDIPNAFSPNGDDQNERFRPVLWAGTLLELQVWSRWGELVYEGDSPAGWDGSAEGRPAAPDVYVYRLRLRLPDGSEVLRHGDVTLLR